MYKVFIQKNAIIFVENNEKINYEGIIISLSEALDNKENLLTVLNNEEFHSYYIVLCHDSYIGMKTFFSNYDFIEAAGGVVKRKNKILFINRLGKWDLPKGKMELLENPEETAIREVEEECGIVAPTIIQKINDTYHTYEYKGKKVLKKCHWYYLNYEGPKELTPQTEEDITEVIWLKEKELSKILKNTYHSIVEVLKSYHEIARAK
jgi:8-oxo-dGTP pyrophosphatase MutT (NUDIX family)